MHNLQSRSVFFNYILELSKSSNVLPYYQEIELMGVSEQVC